MLKGRSIFRMLAGWLVCLVMLGGIKMEAAASNTKDYLDSLNVGISNVLDPCGGDNEEAIEELAQIVEEAEKEKSDLVMADVQVALNVRAEASEDSEKVGLLYKDCGGRILERKDGWTKLESGDLVGWASDEYLLFDEEAEALAGEVGNLIIVNETETLRVRQEPDTDAVVLGLLAQNDALNVVEVMDGEWIKVDFYHDDAYVLAEYVDVDFRIDAGETMAVIRQREEEAEAARKKAMQDANQAIIAEADDIRLLAALIYCEAGSESYQGQLAVGAVVMNRVRSGAYPNTISGVIYASGQFTPAMNGKVARIYHTDIASSCYTAAQEAMAGATNVGGATHFRRAGSHEGILIDNQVFW
ncbi:MAG: cell wall hydrolase [Blautia sp.]|nr:cell wall hydrolase [Blautia sp.]MCM1202022.1 cell wall hydrolase [Bacteroides fragilis]